MLNGQQGDIHPSAGTQNVASALPRRRSGKNQSEAAFEAMADLRFAAWFLWMTPFDAALSS